MSRSVVECVDINKRFGPHPAVDGVSLSAGRGELMTLLGPSGCGKTTTLRLIAGFESPDSGTIAIGGTTVAGPGVSVPPERRRVGIVFQDYSLFPHLDVRANVAYAKKRARRNERSTDELLEMVGLTGMADRMPYELSGGEQQRAALARSLAAEPDVVLLDEPFSNLDASLRARLRMDVREVLRAAGATAIFVTHDIEEALSISDRVAIMFEGRLVQTAEPEELYSRPASKRIARSLGDANFIRGDGLGERVATEIGTLQVAQPVNGPVEVMLRPEWLSVTEDSGGAARVVDREFYGHDQIVKVRLESGIELRVRAWSPLNLTQGQRVAVQARESAITFDENGLDSDIDAQ
ncbi:MAG: ABC transporter ATP-binding protein [Chloroflexi bacterium]|nr:ABC transporter ATP-binding protein [Chloroflexota bacterium]MCY3937087.1 ABC transporter ATP-binding protein [Chloroflexota bacterium]